MPRRKPSPSPVGANALALLSVGAAARLSRCPKVECGMVDDFNPDDFGALVEWLRVGTKKGSARDLQARRMLARMLRSSEPLDQGTRLILADAVDPDGEGGLQ